jgi:DNA-binding NarL/FixJ family response regulator
VTSFSDRVREALAAGAIGYLLKDSTPADVVAGVPAAAAHGSPGDPRVARALLTDAGGVGPAGRRP